MRESSLRYLLAVALVVVAGYGAYVGVSEYAQEPPNAASAATPTETPAVTTTDESPERELAPGLTWDGVTDPSNLSSAHANQLRNTSYATALVETTWSENRSTHWHVDAHTRVGANGSPVSFAWNTSGVPPGAGPLTVDVALWHNGTHSFTRYVDQNGTADYRRSSPERDLLAGVPGRGSFVRSIFGSVNTTVVERIEDDGTTLYRVVSTSQPRYASVSDRPRSNYSLSALVDSSGLVHRYHVAYDVHDDGQTLHVSRTWRLSAVGTTTVEQPPWVDEAKNATANRDS